MLQIKRPSLKVPLLTLLFLLVWLLVAETVMRTPFVTDRLMAPTLNTRHRQFEVQWDRLQKFVRENGRVECIFLGNSMVVSAFNPIVFANAYEAETGERLRCFNFGIDAIPTLTAGSLAQILMEEYQPRLLIYGMDARDLSVGRDEGDTTVIQDMAWLQYRMGNFNLEGWLVEHSALYRSRRLLDNLFHFSYRDTLRSYYGPESPLGLLGYDPVDTIADYINQSPDPNNPEYQIQYYYRLLSSYRILPENQAGLEMLLAQQQTPGQLLLVEMPVPDTYFHFFGNVTSATEGDYATFTNYVSSAASRFNVPFWLSTNENLIPDEGWMDYSHVNAQGAKIFSAWLGQQVGQAVNNGELMPGELTSPEERSP